MGVLDTLRKIRTDGWYSTITGLGSSVYDKSQSIAFTRNCNLTDEQLDAMFNDNDMADTIVSAVVDDALRQGIKIESGENDDDDLEKALSQRCDELGLVAALGMAATMGRLFGGAAIYPILDDGKDPSQPLDPLKVRAVYSLTVLDKRQLTVASTYKDPRSGKLGQPETYRLTMQSGLYAMPIVHESRLVFFGGLRTTRTRKQELNGWDRSALQPVYDVLRKVAASFDSVMNLMQDMSQAVWKLNGLMEMMASEQSELVNTRMQMMELGRSAFRAIMLDNGGNGMTSEEFERKATPTAGIPELLDRGWVRLAAATSPRMPVTRLMGISPAGLNATGDADTRNWYDQVQAFRTFNLGPQATKLVQLVARALGEAEPQRFRVCFPSLWQMTPKEQAELELATAQKDAIYLDKGVLLAEEVTLSRYSDGQFSTDTKVDVELRQALLARETERALEAPKDPEPTPMPPQPPMQPEVRHP